MMKHQSITIDHLQYLQAECEDALAIFRAKGHNICFSVSIYNGVYHYEMNIVIFMAQTSLKQYRQCLFGIEC
jgi:hypothetical protein